MVRPAAPTVRVIQRFEHAARRHPFLDGFGELLRRQRWFSSSGSRRNRLTIGTQHGLIGADRVLHLQYFAPQPLAQITYILLSGVPETSILQKLRYGLGLRFDQRNIVSESTVVGCHLDIDIAALERLNEFKERGGFERPEVIDTGFLGYDHIGVTLGIEESILEPRLEVVGGRSRVHSNDSWHGEFPQPRDRPPRTMQHHSHNGIINRDDFDRMVDLVTALVQRLDSTEVTKLRSFAPAE